ncbi:MAG: isocitrate lyase/PEP mutase family protein [Carboxydocellales bacterium]
MQQRKQLRKLLEAPGLIVAPGAYDALSARLVEQAGFPGVYLTGYGASASILGKADVGLLTMTEMLEQVRNMVKAVAIPVIADADTGYGGILNVLRTVEEYEAAGVAGLHLEDQVFPKRCGHMEGKQVVPMSEHVVKLKVAVKARKDANLLIIARTDARAVNGLADAINRGIAYAEAGADLIFVDAPQSREELKIIAREIPIPVMGNGVEGGKTPFLTIQEWEQLGYKLVIYPVSTLFAATKAVQQVLHQLMGLGHTNGMTREMVTFSQFNELIGLAGELHKGSPDNDR